MHTKIIYFSHIYGIRVNAAVVASSLSIALSPPPIDNGNFNVKLKMDIVEVHTSDGEVFPVLRCIIYFFLYKIDMYVI